MAILMAALRQQSSEEELAKKTQNPLTLDLQVVRGAQKHKITLGSSPLGTPFIASKRSSGVATILGLRLKMIF